MHHTGEFTELPSNATAARHARVRVREACEKTFDGDRLDEAELLVSEVVTNALRYGAAPVELAVSCDAERVLVKVRNRGTERPRLVHPTMSDEGGRGLVLVDALSDQWGVQGDQNATVVWFSLRSVSRPG